MNEPAPTKTPDPMTKLLLEMGPLVLFFLFNAFGSQWFGWAQEARIFWATGIFMAAVAASLAYTFLVFHHVAIMPLVTGVVVLVFGSLTIYLHDETFIKVKPTIVNGLFAFILLTGLLFGRNLLKLVLNSVFELTDEGWTILARRWGFFFIVLALVNEAVWRTQSTDFWVAFKVWGIMPLTIFFTMTQMPLIMKHSLKKPGEDEL